MDKSVLKKATSDSSEPTLGHLYREIAQMTFADGKVCGKVATFLMDERLLKSKSKHQIIKTLKVIKHCAADGHSDFQKILQKRSDELRDFANYRGARDALYGDSLNDQIKTAARDAIDALYVERQTPVSINPIVGLGGGSVEKTSGESDFSFASGIAAQPAQGFGSSDAEARFKSEWNKIHNPAASAAASGANATYLSQFTKAAKTGFGIYGDSHQDRLQKIIEKGDATQYGGIQINTVPGVAPQAPPPSTFKFLSEKDSADAPTVKVNDAAVSLNRAQQIVDEIVELAEIGRSELTKFLRDVAEVDAQGLSEDLAARLDDKLRQDMPWKKRLHALTCIEGLAKAKNEVVMDYFTENPEDVYRNVNVVQQSVKQKAKKCIAALSLPPKPGVAKDVPAADVAAPSNGEYTGGTLGNESFASMASESEPVRKSKKGKDKDVTITRKRKSAKGGDAAMPVPPVVPAAAADDMFAGMMTMGVQPQQQQPQVDLMAMPSDGLGMSANPPAAGGMGVFGVGGPVGVPAVQPAVPAVPKSVDPFDDFFAPQPAAVPAVAPVAPVVPAAVAPGTALQPPSVASTNSLDSMFLTNDPSRQPPPMQPVPAAPQAPGSFDSLFGNPAPVVSTIPQVQAPLASVPVAGPLDFAPKATPAPAVPAALPSVPKANDGLGDLFGDAPAAQPAAQPAAAPAPSPVLLQGAPVAAAARPMAVPPPAPAGGDLFAQAAAISDPTARMQFIQDQQRLIQEQIKALQGQ